MGFNSGFKGLIKIMKIIELFKCCVFILRLKEFGTSEISNDFHAISYCMLQDK